MNSELKNNLPPSWTITKLGDICEKITDGTHDTPKYQSSGYPLITSKNLKFGFIDFDNIKLISQADYIQINLRSKVNRGDILFAMIGTIGNPVIVNYDKQFAIKNVGLFKPQNRICLNRYICYWLQSQYLNLILEKEQLIKGTTQKFIPLGHLKIIPIPLPPLPEQHRIVAKLEELFSQLDVAVSALKKAKEQISRYKQSVLSYAFSGKLVCENAELRMLNSEWKKKRICDVAKVNPRLDSNPDDNVEVSFLPMKMVEAESGKYNLSDIRKFGVVKKGFTQFQNGDIIFAKITPCMENGKIALLENLINGVGCGSTEFHVIRVYKTEVIPKFMFYFVLQETFRKNARNNMKGTAGQLRVPADFLKNSAFSIPNSALQNQIVSEIEARFSETENLEKTIDLSLIQAESLRQSILKKAFEGRLVPQDPNDEPASVLLERIKKC
ncbi:MAG: restriction modification system specificity domain protein [Ignavibacteria bacterium]|nr:restriction modification system specificity domain protein [Ignavibacteria bacterium]